MERRPTRDAEGRQLSPVYPELTLSIVMARDFEGLTFPEIAARLKMTRYGVGKQYDKWSRWARQQPAYQERLKRRG